MKEHASLQPLVETYQAYEKALDQEQEALGLLENESDEELKQLAKEELEASREAKEKLLNQLKILLLPKDPNDEKNVIIGNSRRCGRR